MTAFPQPIRWGPQTIGGWGSTSLVSTFGNGYAMNDADNSHAMVAIAPKDGTINAVGVMIQALTGNPPAYYVGLVTVDTGTGDPTATGYGGSAIETYDFTGTGWVWITLATPATAAAGALVAVRVWPTASAPDGSNYVRIGDDTILITSIPYRAYYATSWAAHEAHIPGLAFRYDTGEVVGLPAISYLYGNVDSGTTPDEVGNKFVLPADMKCIGATIIHRAKVADCTYTIKLYDSANNVLASIGALDEDVSAGTLNPANVYWDEVSLSAGSTYRITVLPGSTVDSAVAALDFDSESSKIYMIPDGANWQATSRTDAGAWTDDASGIVFLCLLISDITFTTTGGGGAYGFAG